MERLDDEDLRRCLDGARELTRHAARATLSMFTNHPRCGASCAGTAGHTLLHLDVLRQPDCLTFPLHVWSGSFGDVGAHGACSLCKTVIQGRAREERKKIWLLLPSIFNLEVADWAA